MLTVLARLSHNHSANAYFVNPGYRHSGVCRNPVDKLSFLYKESFFILDSGIRQNDDAVALISRAIVVVEYTGRIIALA